MSGFEDQGKRLKTAMQSLDADMFIVRVWLKQYEKIKKQMGQVGSNFLSVREDLEQVESNLSQLEKMIIGYPVFDHSSQREFQNLLKDMNRIKGNLNHEFLISSEDYDFWLSFSALQKLGPEYASKHKEGIIVQSEIENLLAMTREALERPQPDLVKLTFFYMGRSDKELAELPFPDKVDKVERVFQNEFLSKFMTELVSCIEKARELKEKIGNATDRKSQNLLQAVSIFTESDLPAEEVARSIIDKMLEVG